MGRHPQPSAVPTHILQALLDSLSEFLNDPGSYVLILAPGEKLGDQGRPTGNETRQPRRQRPVRPVSSGEEGGSDT